jgi:hypothetical protein
MKYFFKRWTGREPKLFEPGAVLPLKDHSNPSKKETRLE